MPEPVTFFDFQETAKRRSGWTLFGFFLTVCLTIAAFALAGGYGAALSLGEGEMAERKELFTTGVWAAGVGATVVIFLSWLVRSLGLSAGPAAVMKSLGGHKVEPDTDAPDERRLLNLVEEMSIASGVPMPDVYLLDSPSINACASGLETDKSAVAVTRGAVVRLERDELQGVIAHEFSHILNGDMALNTQLIAWLAGLFTLGEVGRVLMTLSCYDDRGGGWTRNRDDRGNHPAIIVTGLVIWTLGSIGVFFGKMLQAAASRQREYLADASAVQYTRHPEGIGNALRKLGSGGVRGRMVRARTDCGHLMFANLRPHAMAGALSTHPPLKERIRRILPEWDGTYLQTVNLQTHTSKPPPPSSKPASAPLEPLIRNVPATAVLLNLLEQHQLPDAARLKAARAWRDALPPEVLAAARDPDSAPVLVYVLLLHDPPEEQIRKVRARAGDAAADALEVLREKADIPNSDRLAVLDLALPALRRMDADARAVFLDTVDALSHADGRIDLFEYALRKILEHALAGPKERADHKRMRVHISKLATEVNVMLSVLSRYGSDSEEEARKAFQAAEDRMFGYTAGNKLELLPSSECGLAEMDAALEKLPSLAPNFQRRLLLAGLAAAAADKQLKPIELEAFRAFAAALRVPVPPALGFGSSD